MIEKAGCITIPSLKLRLQLLRKDNRYHLQRKTMLPLKAPWRFFHQSVVSFECTCIGYCLLMNLLHAQTSYAPVRKYLQTLNGNYYDTF